MTRPLILIADDYEVDVMILSETLGKKYHVITAMCCDDVDKVVEEHKNLKNKIDLIIMDLRLKIKNEDPRDPRSITGYHTYRKLKRRKLLVNTEVLFTTNYSLDKAAKALEEKRFKIYFKETEPMKLLRTVDDMLGKKKKKGKKNE